MKTYLDGLQEAYAAANAKPMALACMAAADIKALIDAKEKRLAPIKRERERVKTAMAGFAIRDA